MSRICGPIKKKEVLVALLKPEGLTLFLARRIYYRWVFLKYLFFFPSLVSKMSSF